ncbi:uncharacterized protein LOC122716892 [Apis laboriosa]|uniref:uncharacterized protein LOC122716892 n=1 Tax=Apis laboriosa TaxID=183418 RepID=UPI001CC44BF0|nr:uncharacterized protein LOC122716892 [Apis laboriosa]
METIRLANFSCMYINVRFVAIVSRDCPFLKASKRLNIFALAKRFSRTFQYAIALLALFSLLQQPIESKKVIIHVPYRVKNVKHVHTIYKIIPHYREDKKEDLEEDDKYEIY